MFAFQKTLEDYPEEKYKIQGEACNITQFWLFRYYAPIPLSPPHARIHAFRKGG